MKITNSAEAGTTDPCDCMVTLEKGEGGIEFSLESKVICQYGKQIRRVVLKTLEGLQVTDVKISVTDMGALDWTIRARVQCAVYRACQQTEQLPWGGLAG